MKQTNEACNKIRNLNKEKSQKVISGNINHKQTSKQNNVFKQRSWCQNEKQKILIKTKEINNNPIL